MESQKNKTLQEIASAIDLVNIASQDPDNSVADQAALDRSSVLLQEMQNAIILGAEQDLVALLDEPGKDLSALADQLKKSTLRLKKIAATVGKVSQLAGLLVKGIQATSGLGLL